MKIKRHKLDFEEREIAEELLEEVIHNEDKLMELIYEYVHLKNNNLSEKEGE